MVDEMPHVIRLAAVPHRCRDREVRARQIGHDKTAAAANRGGRQAGKNFPGRR
jgi:hypothetical protein